MISGLAPPRVLSYPVFVRTCVCVCLCLHKRDLHKGNIRIKSRRLCLISPRQKLTCLRVRGKKKKGKEREETRDVALVHSLL